MKVCYVTHLPNLTGASQSLLDLLAGWKNYDIEPIVLLGQKGPLENELKRMEIAYKIIPYATAVKGRNPFKNYIKQIVEKLAFFRIKKFYREEKVDIVHNNCLLTSVGMKAAYKLKIPYISHNRELVWEDHKLKMLHEDELNFYLKHATLGVYISNFVQQKYLKIAPYTRYETLYDGIDINKYFISGRFIFQSDTINILMAGRIAPGKGQLEAIKAVEYINQNTLLKVKMYIVGSAANKVNQNYHLKIMDYVKVHELKNIEFIEFTDLRQLREKTDIGLMCSSNEAMGRVTIENMLSGCLTIGAAAGATTELIQNGVTGLLYQAGNYKDLAKKIKYAMENPVEMRAIAEAGQRYAKETFALENYNKKLYGLYKDILKNETFNI